MARADQGMGAGATGQQGAKGATTTDGLTETDLAADIMGDNSLQGNDQLNVQNERKAQADALQESTGVVESAKRMDKDYRAQTELGKGNRYPDEHAHNADAADGETPLTFEAPSKSNHDGPADVNHDAWKERKDGVA